MSDSYQAVYDAVRSRISSGNVGNAVETVMREANISFYFERALSGFGEAAYEMSRPCVLFKPKISIDGNQYCALYGEDLQNGVSGFGDSPSLAMLDFDKSWHEKHPRSGESTTKDEA